MNRRLSSQRNGKQVTIRYEYSYGAEEIEERIRVLRAHCTHLETQIRMFQSEIEVATQEIAILEEARGRINERRDPI